LHRFLALFGPDQQAFAWAQGHLRDIRTAQEKFDNRKF
jgi:hypothetical protein